MLFQTTYKKTFLYKTNTTNKIRHNYPKTLKSLYIGTPHSPPTRRARKCQTKTELLRTKTEQDNGKCRDPTKKEVIVRKSADVKKKTKDEVCFEVERCDCHVKDPAPI